jgi:hypothetical protein
MKVKVVSIEPPGGVSGESGVVTEYPGAEGRHGLQLGTLRRPPVVRGTCRSGSFKAGEDLEQVARLALVKAVDRFDIQQGTTFVGFAVLTITGEGRRHFRDTRS